MGLLSGFYVVVMGLLCDCYKVSLWLIWGFKNVVSLWLLCGCYVVATYVVAMWLPCS